MPVLKLFLSPRPLNVSKLALLGEMFRDVDQFSENGTSVLVAKYNPEDFFRVSKTMKFINIVKSSQIRYFKMTPKNIAKFIKFAKRLNATIVYISDLSEEIEDNTIENLNSGNFEQLYVLRSQIKSITFRFDEGDLSLLSNGNISFESTSHREHDAKLKALSIIKSMVTAQ